jgi:hypothetical protein
MWLNEGLAQWFEGLRPRHRYVMTEAGLAALERRWRATSISVMQRRHDYLVSLELVTRLMLRMGQETLLENLVRLRSVRNPLDLEIKALTLREWLLSADMPEMASGQQKEIVVERDVEWNRQLAEEVGELTETGGKVYDFNKGKQDKETGVTRLPLREMLKKAPQNGN